MDVKRPFFSVIVPEHNSEKFMRRGLDSIREQTFKDYELIIVCDRCTDRTEEIAREYSEKVFGIDAGRCAAARNRGLDEAKGEWILFMDDDDWWMEDTAFSQIARRILDEDEDFDVLAFAFMWKDKGITIPTPARPWTAVWHKAWKREFIMRIGARFPMWEHSDDDGFTKAALPKARIIFWDKPLYFYNFMREGSLTWQMEQGLIPWDFPGRGK